MQKVHKSVKTKEKQNKTKKVADNKQKKKSISKEKAKINARKQYVNVLNELTNGSIININKKKKTKKYRELKSGLTMNTQTNTKTLQQSKNRSKSSMSRSLYCNYPTFIDSIESIVIQSCQLMTQDSLINFSGKTSQINSRKNLLNSQKKQKTSQKSSDIIQIQNIDRINTKIRQRSAIKIQRAWRNYKFCSQIQKIINDDISGVYNKQQIFQKQQVNNQNENVCCIGDSNQQQKNDKYQKKQCYNKINQALKILQKYRKQKITNNHQQKHIIQNQHKTTQQINNLQQTLPYQYSHPSFFKINKIKNDEQNLNDSSIQNNLSDNKVQLTDNKVQLTDNKVQLTDNEVQLTDNKVQLTDNEVQFNDKSTNNSPQLLIYKYLTKKLYKNKQKELTKIWSECSLQSVQHKNKIQQYYQKQIYKYQNAMQIHTQLRTKLKNCYLSSMSSMKRNYKQSYHDANIQYPVSIKRTFSAGNSVFKILAKNVKQIQYIQSDCTQSPLIFDSPINHQARNNTQQSDPEKFQFCEIEQNNNVVYQNEQMKDKQTSQLTKQADNSCKEQVVTCLSKYLIQEFICEIYMSEIIYDGLSLYFDDIYCLPSLNDQQILRAFKKLEEFKPQNEQSLRLVNQKINPTSLQILKVVRDVDFQMDQYDLMLPLEAFERLKNYINEEYLKKQLKIEQKYQNSQNNIYNFQFLADDKCKNLIKKRNNQKISKIQKYTFFERDIRFVYFKSIFNCMNEFYIDIKSSNCFTNARTSIGPGQLTLAIKQYNKVYNQSQMRQLQVQVFEKFRQIMENKIILPKKKNQQQLQLLTYQLNESMKKQFNENQYKWVNYMDQVLEIWLIVSSEICLALAQQLADQLLMIKSQHK